MTNEKNRALAEAQNNGKSETGAFDSPVILTVPQTAAELKCCRRYVENKIRSGELRAYRVGAKFTRIHRRDLEAFLERHATA